MPLPEVSLKRIKFSDDTEIEMLPNDIIVLVGPNNSGKSAALRGIYEKLENKNADNPVIKDVLYNQEGNLSDFVSWLAQWARKSYSQPGIVHYSAFGVGINQNSLSSFWQNNGAGFRQMSRWFSLLLNTEHRLSISKSVESIDMLNGNPVHPVHFLFQDDMVEGAVSKIFKEAFGVDLIVYRFGGNRIPLLTGDKPTLFVGENVASKSYLEKLKKLPELQLQGDGMRSFAGILLSVSVGKEKIILIDEPEAFLHPPQAQLMGEFLVKNKRPNCQIIISTHSTDVLKGILNVGASNVRVLRITRKDTVNNVKIIDNNTIKSLWTDPILRFSNILDGVFHDLVIVCESDSDCRFYSAIWDAIREEWAADKRPNILFTHCGGKARLSKVVKALKFAGVHVIAVADFDILSDEVSVKEIAEEFGIDWALISHDWKLVKCSIDAKKGELPVQKVKEEIIRILNGETGDVLSDRAKDNIRYSLRKDTPWSYVKSLGKSFVPSGNPTNACERLLESLKRGGLYVVEVGELESFYKGEGGHGPAWVNKVVTKDIRTDHGFDVAKAFVRQFPQIPSLP